MTMCLHERVIWIQILLRRGLIRGRHHTVSRAIQTHRRMQARLKRSLNAFGVFRMPVGLHFTMNKSG